MLQVRAPYEGFDLSRPMNGAVAAIVVGLARSTRVDRQKGGFVAPNMLAGCVLKVEEKPIDLRVGLSTCRSQKPSAEWRRGPGPLGVSEMRGAQSAQPSKEHSLLRHSNSRSPNRLRLLRSTAL